ncbi:MAG: hypothetical protein GY710_26890 [Desulfobacteraceae bacterium]|nr:hypothetical protein [Desulfobacteraceae bacterium]
MNLYEGQQGKSQFASFISKILIETNSSAGRALIALKTAKGALPLSLFAKASGTATNSKSKKHTPYKKVLSQLKELDLAHITPSSSNEEIVCLHGMADIPSLQQATFLVEDIVLSIVKQWIANLGLGSFNKITTREESPTYGIFAWDIVSPSYVNGLVKYTNGEVKNGFLVGDIILNKQITVERLKPFFYKIDSLNHQRNIRPFIALIIAEYFDSDSLKQLRKRGVIIANPKTILGKENAELLQSLIKSIDNATKTIKENPDELFGIIKKISKIEGASLNLRSVVLDFIIARLYSIQGFNCDLRHKIITKQGYRSEIDVVASRAESIVCIEGKAVAPGNKVKKIEIESWIEKSFPRIKNWLNESEHCYKVKKMEFYSSTDFNDEALILIKEIEAKYRKIQIKFLNSTDILKELKRLKQKSLVEIFKEQFT